MQRPRSAGGSAEPTRACEWRTPTGRIVLEVDGSFHLQVARWWADMRRERAVVLSGTAVLRCASIELRAVSQTNRTSR